MALRVSNLRLPVEEPEANLPAHLAGALGVRPADLGGWRVVRKALDLRDKRQLRFVYNFEVEFPRRRLPPRRFNAGRTRRGAAVRHARARLAAAAAPAGRGRLRAGRAAVRLLPGAARLPPAGARTRHQGERPHPRRAHVRRRRRLPPREQLPVRRGRGRHLLRRQAHLPQHRAGRDARARTVRRVQGAAAGEAEHPLLPPPAPRQQPPPRRGEGDPPQDRGARRRGPLPHPRRGRAVRRRRAEGRGHVRRVHPGVGGGAGPRTQCARHVHDARGARACR